MRPIGMVTRDIRRQRAREHYDRKREQERWGRISESLIASLNATNEIFLRIYGEQMLRDVSRARTQKPTLLQRIGDHLSPQKGLPHGTKVKIENGFAVPLPEDAEKYDGIVYDP